MAAIRYIIEVILCSGLFAVFYRWLLARKVSFRLCRAYILATVALAIAIPAMNVPLYTSRTVADEIFETITLSGTAEAEYEMGAETEIAEAAAPVPAEAGTNESKRSIDYLAWIKGGLSFIYIVTALASLALIIINSEKIRRLRKRSQLTHTKEYTLAENKEVTTPFSFLRTIFLGMNYVAQEREQILTHEASHVRHGHSYERIALSVIRSLFWFNPFFWMAESDLEEVQEWEADKDVLEEGHNLKVYRTTIFKQLFGYNPEISCGLNNSLTKQRFIMMTQNQNGRGTLLRLAATLPALAACFFAFGCGMKSLEEPAAIEANLTDGAEVTYIIPCIPKNGIQSHYGDVSRDGAHEGIDFVLDEGAPVWAAADGKVIDVHDGYRSLLEYKTATIKLRKPYTLMNDDKGYSVYDCGNGTTLTSGYNVEGGDYFTSKTGGKGYGLHVIIEHPDGSRTIYAHLSKAMYLKPEIKAGDVIGYAGSTGDATGSHLHFKVQKKGKPADPGKMEPIQSIMLTVKGEKVYHAGKELDLSKGEVTELAMEFKKINDMPTIHIKAEGDVKVGTVTDIKEQLRAAETLRLRYVNDAGDVNRFLPPPATSDSQVKVVERPENMVRDRNLICIKINEQAKVLMFGNDSEYYVSDIEDFDTEALKRMIVNAGNNPKLPEKTLRDIHMSDGSTWSTYVSKAFISLQPNEETKQNAFIALERKIRQAYGELRDELSMEKFGRKMDELSQEEKQVIYEAIPINVSEAEPRPKVKI